MQDAHDVKPCPCGTGRTYAECCGAIISGRRVAETAEALMRSRYTAYATLALDWIEATARGPAKVVFDRDNAARWAETSAFTGLHIKRTAAGGPGDQRGVVEFEAFFTEAGQALSLKEVSAFEREDGAWYYVGVAQRPQGIGRNDPCPCGSGKKFKKCCGA